MDALTAILVTLAAMLIGELARRIWLQSRKIEVPISVHIGKARVPSQIGFGLLHIRDGDGPEINKEYYFREVTRGELVALVRTATGLGFQYKCFVNHAGIAFEDAKSFLEARDLLEVTQGAGKSNRAWFLLPGADVVTTDEGIRNNVRYPS